ncbi:hypothetical protein NKH18_42750 [Streptomyces sp. M10(2022)]
MSTPLIRWGRARPDRLAADLLLTSTDPGRARSRRTRSDHRPLPHGHYRAPAHRGLQTRRPKAGTSRPEFAIGLTTRTSRPGTHGPPSVLTAHHGVVVREQPHDTT